MKYLIFFLFLSVAGFGQSESENYKQISRELEIYYNEGEYESIFELYDESFKSEFSIDETRSFFTNLKFQLGNIEEREFKQFVRQSFASYKTTFEGGLFALNISVDDKNRINGLYIEPYREQKIIPISERNKTRFILPFKEKWFVFWGGDTKAQNYHVESKAQKNAFDFVIKDDNGKSYKTSGIENEDYYAFGKEIIAPCNAEVVMVVDGIPDNKPGEMNPLFATGNTVVLKTEHNEYLYLAHLKKHSIKVEEGQQVNLGDILGLCGNSGNSSEPHLHFHVQNQFMSKNANGIKTYFAEIYVNGNLQKDHSPVKGEMVSNLP